MSPEQFSLQKMMGFYISRTAFLMSEGIFKEFEKLGYAITAQDFGILNLLWENDGLKHSEIATYTLRDKTTITRRIDGLVKKGILERRTDPQDRRISRVYLSPLGWQIQTKLTDALLNFHLDVLDGISGEDIQTTVNTLTKIISNRIDEPTQRQKKGLK